MSIETDFHIKSSKQATGRFQKVVIDINKYAVLNVFTGEFVSLTSENETEIDKAVDKLTKNEINKIAEETTKIINKNHIEPIKPEDI